MALPDIFYNWMTHIIVTHAVGQNPTPTSETSAWARCDLLRIVGTTKRVPQNRDQHKYQEIVAMVMELMKNLSIGKRIGFGITLVLLLMGGDDRPGGQLPYHQRHL